MDEKPDWKKSDSELREQSFRPRLWTLQKGNHQCDGEQLARAIQEADQRDAAIDQMG